MPFSRFTQSDIQKIDEHNRKLLNFLCTDGRESATHMGKRLRLSREVVGYRMRRMEETGVIQGYAAIPGYKRHSYRQYRVFFLVDEQKKQEHAAFLKTIMTHPNTVSVLHYSDTWDLGWNLVCRDIDEFEEIYMDVMTKHSGVIVEREKFIVITTFASNLLPTRQQPREHHHISKLAQLDDTDRKIMHYLGSHGRASTYEIGAKVGLSSDAVIKRMRRLKEEGFIEWYSAIVNLSALKLQWYTYVVQFSRLQKKDEAKVKAYVAAHPNVLRAAKTFGRWNLMLDIVVESTEKYHEVAKEIKNVFAPFIRKYESWSVQGELIYVPYPDVLLKER